MVGAPLLQIGRGETAYVRIPEAFRDEVSGLAARGRAPGVSLTLLRFDGFLQTADCARRRNGVEKYSRVWYNLRMRRMRGAARVDVEC